MKFETYLNAMIGVKWRIDDLSPRREWKESTQRKRNRQYHAFRDRILRMDAEIEELKARLNEVDGFIHMMEERDVR